MNEDIREIKARLFDLIRAQEALKARFEQIDKERIKLLSRLKELENAERKTDESDS